MTSKEIELIKVEALEEISTGVLRRLQHSIEKIELNSGLGDDFEFSLDDLLDGTSEEYCNQVQFAYADEADVLCRLKSFDDTFTLLESPSSFSSSPASSTSTEPTEGSILRLELKNCGELTNEETDGLLTDLSTTPLTFTNFSKLMETGSVNNVPLKRPGANHLIRKVCNDSFRRMKTKLNVPQKLVSNKKPPTYRSLEDYLNYVKERRASKLHN